MTSFIAFSLTVLNLWRSTIWSSAMLTCIHESHKEHIQPSLNLTVASWSTERFCNGMSLQRCLLFGSYVLSRPESLTVPQILPGTVSLEQNRSKRTFFKPCGVLCSSNRYEVHSSNAWYYIT